MGRERELSKGELVFQAPKPLLLRTEYIMIKIENSIYCTLIYIYMAYTYHAYFFTAKLINKSEFKGEKTWCKLQIDRREKALIKN